ncbi:MAG: hypothetical protein KAR11_05955 [Phycisphaerae bacterium]|nr:hypothetical protein [Phycisphaerae bacterium]
MNGKRVKCPSCATVLGVPGQFKGTLCLCANCQTKFTIPALSEADILDLIGKKRNADSVVAGAIEADEPQPVAADFVPETVAAEVAMDTIDGFPTGIDGFYLLRIDRHGTLFEFPASILTGTSLRGAMPRRCVRCGETRHIQYHLVIYSHHMTESASLESQYAPSRKELSERDVMTRSADEILPMLPEVRKIPAPANLPMPYWVCDMCSPSNMVFAQNRITSSGESTCRLQIQRIWRAEEFLVAAGGKDSRAHKEILKEIEGNAEQPWDTLPGAVQQRLQQWYHPHKGERFVAYIPDRSRVRTQDGMGGVVLSNRRLVHNSLRRYHEVEKGEQLDMDFAMSAGKMTLHIKTPSWEVKQMVVDKHGLERLRRAMWQENFPAVWH